MSDKIAREKATEQFRQEALLRKRSKVLQRELPRPPSASLELIRSSLIQKDEDKSSFVPPTLFEQADEMINKELLALLEHDDAKYPLEEKVEKERKKGGKRVVNGKNSVHVPEIEDFEENELQEADSLIEEEVQFLRLAMGHENESLDDFVRARDACQEDLMYFRSRNSFGLASVAGNSEKLAAFQNDFEIMKKRMDDEAKKATKLENKIKLLTHGLQTRAGKLWSQREATFRQMDTAATEFECFQTLRKQEVISASYRISNLVEEINRQKALERNLQQRYEDVTVEHDRVQRLLDEHMERSQLEEEITAKNQALEEEMSAQKQALEEEMAAKNRALEEENTAKKHALEEENTAKNHALEEENTAKNHAPEEETVTRNHAVDEEVESTTNIGTNAKLSEGEKITVNSDANNQITDISATETDAVVQSTEPSNADPRSADVVTENSSNQMEAVPTLVDSVENTIPDASNHNSEHSNAPGNEEMAEVQLTEDIEMADGTQIDFE